MTFEFEFLRELIVNLDKEPLRKILARKFRSLYLALADEKILLRTCTKKLESIESKMLLKLIFLSQKINPVKLKKYLEKLLEIMYTYCFVRTRIRKMKKSLKIKVLILSSVSSLLTAVFLSILSSFSYSVLSLNKNLLVAYACLTFTVLIIINTIITTTLFKNTKMIFAAFILPTIGLFTYFILVLLFW